MYENGLSSRLVNFDSDLDDLGPDGSTGYVGDRQTVNAMAHSLFNDIKNGGERGLRAVAVLISTDLYRKKVDLDTIKDTVFDECWRASEEYYHG